MTCRLMRRRPGCGVGIMSALLWLPIRLWMCTHDTILTKVMRASSSAIALSFIRIYLL